MVFQLQLDTETVERAHFAANPILVEPQTTVRRVLELLKESDQGSVLVCQDGQLVGIFTERDALRLMASGGPLDGSVDQVMVKDVVTIRSTDTVKTAITRMSIGGYRRLPVMDSQGQPVGLLKVSNVLHYLVEHIPKSVYNLPPKPRHTTPQREGA